MFYGRNGEKMRLLIVCIIYAVLVTMLRSSRGLVKKRFFSYTYEKVSCLRSITDMPI